MAGKQYLYLKFIEKGMEIAKAISADFAMRAKIPDDSSSNLLGAIW